MCGGVVQFHGGSISDSRAVVNGISRNIEIENQSLAGRLDCFVASAFRLRSSSFGGRSRSLSYGGQVAPPQEVVIVRLDRTIQYPAASPLVSRPLWHTGSPLSPAV